MLNPSKIKMYGNVVIEIYAKPDIDQMFACILEPHVTGTQSEQKMQ